MVINGIKHFIVLITFFLFVTQSISASVPTHCIAGNPEYSGNLPTWSQVKSKNIGNIEQNQIWDQAIVGVPDLDNIGEEFPISDSIENSVNVINQLVNAKILPTVASKILDPDTTGIGICATGPESSGTVPVEITLPITFCEFAQKCDNTNSSSPERILWVPQTADFLNTIKVKIPGIAGGGEKDLFEILEAVESNSALPGDLTLVDGKVVFSENVAIDLANASRKWTKKLTQFLDKVFGMSLADILGAGAVSDALDGLQKKSGELTKAIENFKKQVNLYGEGYHLGAMDNTRPKLHSCIGYYGHGVRSELTSMLNGKVNIASRYKSLEVSKDYKAQARFGLTEIDLFGKTLPLMAAGEANIQFDALSSFDCVTPFGIPMHRMEGDVNLCVKSLPKTNFGQVCGATNGKEDEYAAIPQTNSPASISGMIDYYPINIGDGVVWPRFGATPKDTKVTNPNNPKNPNAYVNLKNNLLYYDNSDDPSTPNVNEGVPQTDTNHSVLSAGLNWAYEGGFPEPKTILKVGPPLGPAPISAELRLDLDWGLNWFHDSFYMRDRLKSALDNSSADIATDDIFERPMHVLQAEDLTAENGNKYYIDPALMLAVGFSYKLPQQPKKPKLFIDIGVDIGLYPHAEVGFSSGIADTGTAVKDALVNSSSNPDLPCSPIIKYEEAPKTCLGNQLDTSERAVAGKLLNDAAIYVAKKTGVNIEQEGEYRITQEDFNAATEDGAIEGAYRYSCDDKEPKILHLYENDLKTPVLNSSGKVVTIVIRYIHCSKGYNGVKYQCTGLKRPKIIGWDGEGCSPLISKSGYPAAPGGSCEIGASGQPLCSSDFSCVQGACLAQCGIDSSEKCGTAESCNSVNNGSEQVCELSNGAPYAEQVAWLAKNPDPAKPLHSVWTHAISEAGAAINFGAGLNLRAKLRLFGKELDLIDKEWDKYWQIASSNVLKYQPGLEAEYNSECSVAGVVKNHQPGSGKNAIWRPDSTNPSHREIEVVSGVTTSQDFIEMCDGDIKDRVLEPDEDINASALGVSVAKAGKFSEDVALEMWETYQDQMCINGMPYKDFIGGMYTNSVENGQGTLAVTASDGAITLLDGNAGIAIAKSSGCLNKSQNFGGIAGLASYVNSLPDDGNGVVDIASMMLDQDEDFVVANFKPQFLINTPLTSPQKNPQKWLDFVFSCVNNYVNNTDFELTNFEVGECESGTPYSDDDPKADPDRDGVANYKDNCDNIFNPNQLDSDNDGIGDVCDNCPNKSNPDQLDSNNDGVGNQCEPTDSSDVVTNGQTPMFNSDMASGSGDWENNERYLNVECQIAGTTYKPDDSLPAGYTCKKARGAWCENKMTTPQNSCKNMRVRWLWDGGATPWFDRDRPSGSGDFETIENQLQVECYFGHPNPNNKFTPQSSNVPAGYTCDKYRGAWCENKKTEPVNSCRVRPVTVRYRW